MRLDQSMRRKLIVLAVGLLALFAAAMIVGAVGIGYFAGVSDSRMRVSASRGVTPTSFGSLVNRVGTYEYPSGERLVVWKEQVALIRFRFEDSNGHVFMQSHPDFNPSDAMKWGIVVDSSRWVWCSSSDIGDAVWRRDDNGLHSQTALSGPGLDPAIASKRPLNLP